MYSIGQFAKKTGLTVRALRFYSDKGLLEPCHISEAGHRYYNDESIVRVQKIMTLKYLDYSLEDIEVLFSKGEIGLIESLQFQRKQLEKKRKQLDNVIGYLDQAIAIGERSETIEPTLYRSSRAPPRAAPRPRCWLRTPGLCRAHELVERTKRFLDRRLRIRLVRQIQVEPVRPEPLEAAFDLPKDPLAREAPVVGIAGHRPVDLAAQKNRRSALLLPFADPALAAASAVGGRRVEEGDPRGQGRVHESESLLLRLSAPEELRSRSDPAEVPAAEPESRELEIGPPKPSCVHVRKLSTPPKGIDSVAETSGEPR